MSLSAHSIILNNIYKIHNIHSPRKIDDVIIGPSYYEVIEDKTGNVLESPILNRSKAEKKPKELGRSTELIDYDFFWNLRFCANHSGGRSGSW